MEIQWSLVLFTAISGMGAWLFAGLGAAEAKGDTLSAKTRFNVALLSLVLIVLGGFISVTHLSHPDRIMGVLGHPTMGIFMEAVFVGVLVVLLAAYLIMLKREAGAGALKGLAIVTAVVAVVFSFMSGYSYMMGAVDAWNTITLPLAYLGTTAAAGTGLYACLVGAMKEEDAIPFAALLTIIGGVLAAVTGLLYGFVSGAAMGPQAVTFWVAVIICGGVAPAACGFLIKTKPAQAVGMGALAAALGLVGCIGLRCVMWLIGGGLNMFGLL